MAEDVSSGINNGPSENEYNVRTVAVTTLTASISFTGALDDDEDDNSTSSENEDQTEVRAPETPDFPSRRPLRESSTRRSNGIRTSVMSLPDLVVNYDHFAPPEGYFDASTTEELEQAISSLKAMVSKAIPHTDTFRELIRKLVQMRLRLLEAKDVPPETNRYLKSVMGHKFEEKPWTRAKGYCEKCCNVIIGIVQSWLKCKECGYCCHKKCLNSITRTCAAVRVLENCSFILDICPERGLHAQNYRCIECRAVIGFQPGMQEARQCDYTGSYYCDQCHWNDTMVVPARVVSNWDFESKKVCRASKAFLRLMMKKPVLDMDQINPMMFTYLEELKDVKDRREQLLVMKKYFLQCPEALKSKLLCQLQGRQHFVDNSEMYSLQDLIDLENDTLLPELTKIHANFAQHIKTDCENCRKKGTNCRICKMDDNLFPFDNTARVCPECSTVMHGHCYQIKNQICPTCAERSLLLVETNKQHPVRG